MRAYRLIAGCLLFLFFLAVPGYAQIISTYAGTGIHGDTGDGGPATSADLLTPSGVATDQKGNVFFSDQNANVIRKVDRFGIITAIAGMGSSGYSGDGGPATAAKIYWPTGVAVDGIGNVFISDQFNNVIRKVDTFGIITTLAGTGTIGYSGDGGPATACQFWHPNDVGVDTAGNVYVADRDNQVIRKITTGGMIYTVAGTNVSGYGGDGGPATNAQLNFPSGICLDKTGDIFVADLYNNRIRKIDTAGIITTIVGTGASGYSGDGGPATAARINSISALSADKIGNIYFADYYNYVIRKIDAAGIISTIAGNGINSYYGDGVMATTASISSIEGVAADTSGNVFIADFYNARVRKISKLPPLRYPDNIAIAAEFKVFPNPSSGLYFISVAPTDKRYSVSVCSENGTVVHRQKLSVGTNELNVCGHPPGPYTVVVDDNGVVVWRQVLIINSDRN